jgi:type VI secretion system secreted protein VgrG
MHGGARRHRWYDPEVGRFIAEDPLGHDAGGNPYTFAADDPVNGLDPSGLQKLCNSVVHRHL